MTSFRKVKKAIKKGTAKGAVTARGKGKKTATVVNRASKVYGAKGRIKGAGKGVVYTGRKK